jgi:Na+-driven multidrug efflux pump
VRATLTNCLMITILYSLVVWAGLFVAAPSLNALFGATGETAKLVTFFCTYGAAAWLFLGFIFVSNAAFNNLGFPIFSTFFNWGRATLGTIPFVTLGAHYGGPEGGLIGMIAGAALFGFAASSMAYVAIGRLKKAPVSIRPE